MELKNKITKPMVNFPQNYIQYFFQPIKFNLIMIVVYNFCACEINMNLDLIESITQPLQCAKYSSLQEHAYFHDTKNRFQILAPGALIFGWNSTSSTCQSAITYQNYAKRCRLPAPRGGATGEILGRVRHHGFEM